MRMIDADKMLERLKVWNTSDNTDKALYNFAWNRIAEQPTAYDVDKVIEQLEELEKEHPYKVIGQPDTYSQYNEAWQDCMDRVLGIVKRSGEQE